MAATFGVRLRRWYVAGILVLAPTALTLWVVWTLFRFFDDILGGDLADAGAGLGGPDTADMGIGATDGMGDQAATSGLADDGQQSADEFGGDLGLGLDSGAADGGFAEPEPAPMETFAPEPVESDFSQQIAQADAVEDSFDNMFDDLGGTGQG